MTSFPAYLHATRQLRRPAGEVTDTLRTQGPTLAAEATTRAVASVEPLLLQGGFRRSDAPSVSTAVLQQGPAVLRVVWNPGDEDRWPPSRASAIRPTSRWWRSDEEETGWPTATFDLVVEPREHGARLAVVSTRRPGTDLSTNRIDRHLRDRIARRAVEEFVSSLVALVDERDGTVADAAPTALSSFPTLVASGS